MQNAKIKNTKIPSVKTLAKSRAKTKTSAAAASLKPTTSEAAPLPRPRKKIYPKTGILLVIVLIALAIACYFVWQKNKELNLMAEEKLNETVQKPIDTFVLPKIASDQVIFSGDYKLTNNAWSSDSQKAFVYQFSGQTEEGDPEYKSYSIFNFTTNTTTAIEIKDNPVSPDAYWIDNNNFATEKRIVDLSNPEQVALKVAAPATLKGFELLDKIKYLDPETKKEINDVNHLSISPDGKNAAFFSRYNSPDAVTFRFYILPLNAKSLDELVSIGNFTGSNDTTYFVWTKDSRYLTFYNANIFDAVNKKIILAPSEGLVDGHVIFSPDSTTALIFRDYAENNPLAREIYLMNLADGKKTDILSIDKYAFSDNSQALDGNFSPNSKYIIYNNDNELWLAEVMTGKKKRLVTGENFYTSPRLSPDGTKILYVVPHKEVRLIKLGW